MQNFYFITGFMGTGKSTLLQGIQTHLEERGKKKEDLLIDSVSYPLPTSVEENDSIKESVPIKENIHHKYVVMEDLDTYILKKIDCSISEYFAEEGEIAFRNLETSCLEEILVRAVQKNKDNPNMDIHVVISLGGGCIFSNEARRTILQFSQLFHHVHCFNLFASMDIINQRLQGAERTQRPLAANQLQETYAQRTEFWPVISEILQHNDISVTEIQSNRSKQDIFGSVWSTIKQSDSAKKIHEEKINSKKNIFLNSKHGVPLLEMPW